MPTDASKDPHSRPSPSAAAECGCDAVPAGAKGLAPLASALAALRDSCPLMPAERVAVSDAAGRVLAEDVHAELDVPPADNSQMDGYCARVADIGDGAWLPISQRIAAGQPATPLAVASSARLFTGAEIPEGADVVVMQEEVTLREGEDGTTLAWLPGPRARGDNIRVQGRDVSKGSRLLAAGTRLDAAALGLLCGQGASHVLVRRKVRVALFATGDELIEPGQPLKPGQIYNSNRVMLSQMLSDFGAEVVLAPLNVADTFEATRDALASAAQQADLIVTCGGVSVGEEDHVRPAIEALGSLDLWRLAIKPGKPLALGRINSSRGDAVRVVGLPGNPVSSWVGGWLFLRPLLGEMTDCTALRELKRLTVRAAFSARTAIRQDHLRVTLAPGSDGQLEAHAFPDQNSAVLSSCAGAQALAVIPPHAQLNHGDSVECLWLEH
ncbi:molybdopterin molybdotransferase MoeA [Cobetia sp. 4B]|uniref:molybdopterin molybdotransferase MoeA n=1 Tax=Cobetia sp. 4B TaxID=2758724 RepID=UPI001C03FC8C|nr:gephyrin-like molybdotransferase Glp [Cobetia sp. 4B]MBR9754668.1 molybdopterin molybdotransferase MoeA [Gammaproteobacteria bacterium]QWN38436.1 molybdopterin molybdotransferase MoeA [Cobetia sp. 4B]